MQGEQVTAWLLGLLRQELAATPSSSSIERLSIALGAVELALTPRDQSLAAWPADLPATVDRLAAAYDAFAEELSASPTLAAAGSAAAKIKAVADAVWSKLSKGSYSKDLPHAQHVYNFAAALLSGGLPGVKRQLDCAGVVTTTYSLCQALYQRHPERHADLAGLTMAVSEDHCWLHTSSGSRETSVEVTTDTAAKRGLPVAADAWRGWLYLGGDAVLCSPHQALAAIVASINPSVSSGKKGQDSEELQGVQRALLEALLEEQPGSLYPAALCALADLKEVSLQDQLDTARDAGDSAAVARLLQRSPGDCQDLFEQAIRLAAGGSSGGDAGAAVQAAAGAAGDAAVPAAAAAAVAAANGSVAVVANGGMPDPQAAAASGDASAWPSSTSGQAAHGNGVGGSGSSSIAGSGCGGQWYVYSYIATFLGRRAEFLGSCGDVLLPPSAQQQQQQQEQEQQPAEPQQPAGPQQEQPAGEQQHPYWQQAVATYREALRWAGAGAGVLRRYRFQPASDEQLFKDIEGVLDEVFKDGLATLAKRQPGGLISDPSLFQPLLELWDGVCHLFAGRAKPTAWVALLLRCAKLFTPDARAAAAEAAAAAGQVTSGPMQRVRAMWRELKPLATLRQQFESADVAATEGSGGSGGEPEERATKRRRGA